MRVRKSSTGCAAMSPETIAANTAGTVGKSGAAGVLTCVEGLTGLGQRGVG
jgi:hypothetical protein